ncbi:MAG: hypothetical protein AAFR23_08245 [Pseudomonadota bacterium]
MNEIVFQQDGQRQSVDASGVSHDMQAGGTSRSRMNDNAARGTCDKADTGLRRGGMASGMGKSFTCHRCSGVPLNGQA